MALQQKPEQAQADTLIIEAGCIAEERRKRLRKGVADCYGCWILDRRAAMPKSASPVRLQQQLMDSATLAGARQHRSAAEQIEYWAALGQQVAGVLDPDKLLEVLSGLAALKVVPVAGAAVNPEQAFEVLERERQSGQLTEAVSSAPLRYQASETKPGWLEQISPDGRRKVGRFRNGVFEPLQESSSP